MRGKLCRHGQTRRHDGITPADAGKTPSCTTFAPLVQDHPRGCGENWYLSPSSDFGFGITPADAGKTRFFFFQFAQFMDHPRGCGENAYGEVMRQPDKGSPPRMRGKLPACINCGIALRITPADAGKTPLGAGYGDELKDHPRGCGENLKARRDPQSLPGSPPRMRGKLPACINCGIALRITPADAGKTPLGAGYGDELKDHPRGCGENLKARRDPQSLPGSPPRMRGKPSGGGADDRTVRITPADAGKTFVNSFILLILWDHPRGCGENTFYKKGTCHIKGSPPRMRGKHLHRRDDVRYTRITPADAGKTVTRCNDKVPISDHPRGCGENPPA